jgi:UDP-glucose 4-epimerase
MRVLITGGAGFIGSHLADVLIARGDKVVALDNFSTGSTANIKHITKNFEILDGDIRNTELINETTKDVDLVFHMAAALGVNTILESPLESLSTNITGSEVVLGAAARYKKRILIASTSEIYGKNPNQPLRETDDRVVGSPQKIRWSYSDAKAIEEAMAVALHQEKNLQVTTARLFNTVGPRQSGRYGMVVMAMGHNLESSATCRMPSKHYFNLLLQIKQSMRFTTLVVLVKLQSNNWPK